MQLFRLDNKKSDPVKDALRNRSLSQKELANIADCHDSTVSRFLQGELYFSERICQAIIAAIFGENSDEARSWQQYCTAKDESASLLSETAHTPETPSPYSIEPSQIPHNLQPTHIKLFDRDEHLVELNKLLKQPKGISTVAITGMPGVGKSELALQYAWNHLQDYPGGVFWVNIREGNVAEKIILQFVRNQGNFLPEANDPYDLLPQCWRDWPNSPAKILLILDDLSNLKILQKVQRGMDNSRFHVLVTARQRLEGISTLSLQSLSLEKAVAIFTEALPNDPRLQKESKTLEEICEWLGCLPLGLQLVRHYLTHVKNELLQEVYAELRVNSVNDPAVSEADPLSNAQYAATAAFELSWVRLPEEAHCLAYFLSLFAAAPIAQDLVHDAVIESLGRGKFRLARLALLKAYLLQDDLEKQTYHLHRLVREFFKVKLATTDWTRTLLPQVCRRLIPFCQSLPERPDKSEIQHFIPIQPHVAELINTHLFHIPDEAVALLFNALRRFYQGQGFYSLAQQWAEKGLAVTQERFGQNCLATAIAYKNVGLVKLFLTDYPGSERSLQAAFHLIQNLQEEHSLTAAEIQKCLAALYRDCERFDEANTAAQIALAICRDCLGDEHDLTIEAKFHLATIALQQGNHEAAETYGQMVIEARTRLLGEDHQDTLDAMNFLAVLYEKTEKCAEAQKIHQKILEIFKHRLGKNHPLTAGSTNNLAKVLHKQGCFDEAEPLFKEAIAIFKKIEDLRSAAVCQYNLGILYYDQGQYREALTITREAYDVFNQVHGSNHHRTQECMISLGKIQQQLV